MKIKTADLIGTPLDWAVATALGYEIEMWHTYVYLGTPNERIVGRGITIGQRDEFGKIGFEPSTEGGTVIDIMEGERINASFDEANWYAFTGEDCSLAIASTLRIAVCRCFVASKMGDEVDIPEELL